jgi:hypothetical protein
MRDMISRPDSEAGAQKPPESVARIAGEGALVNRRAVVAEVQPIVPPLVY